MTPTETEIVHGIGSGYAAKCGFSNSDRLRATSVARLTRHR